MPTAVDLPPDREAVARACVTSDCQSDASDVIRAAPRQLKGAEARPSQGRA